MRHLPALALLALAACGSDPTATPDPTESAAGVGGATSADASSADASSTDAAASQSATDASASAAEASSSDASSGVGGEGGAPPATSSSSTGAGGDGGAPTQGGGYTDGARIRPRYLVATDGLVAPTLDFYDTQLREPCYWYQTSAAQRHCLPAGGGSVSTLYADAACTQQIGTFVGCNGASGEYAAKTEIVTAAGCSQALYSMYQRGVAVPVGDPIYVLTTSNVCLENGTATATTFRATPVPLSTFVSAEVVVGEP